MRVVIQRVTKSYVGINGKESACIGPGLMVLAGFEEDDISQEIIWMAKKIANLRIFDNIAGVMNKSILESNGDILIISQFTLHAKTKKGNRPSYIQAAPPEIAIPLYEQFIVAMEKELCKPVKAGVFGAHMKVSLVNDGPVTIIIDTKNKE